METSVPDIDAELVRVNAKITASTAILGILTDPDDLRDESYNRDRLMVRKTGLENRREDANVAAIIMVDFELEEIAVRLTKVEALIAGLNTRKTEIEAAAGNN